MDEKHPATSPKDLGVDSSDTSLGDSQPLDDKALEKRVTRKIDARVVPMLGMLYMTAYLDRTNIGNAKLLGLEADLNMPSNGYNTAVWTFYLTFVLMEVPSNLLMNYSKIPPNYWLATSMVLLGIVTMCQGFVQSPVPLYICRLIMGIFEGSLGPAAALMMGSYYRKREFPFRYCCFTTSALIGASFSSFLAYAINFMDGVQGLESWRWIFILEGLFNICVAATAYYVLPPFPAESNFLEPEEKEHLLHRLAVERGDEAVSLKGSPWLSWMLDPYTWLNIVFYFGADISAASISQFSPTIIRNMGYTANGANLRNVPIWLGGACISVTVNIISGKTGYRFPFILFGTILCTIGWTIQLAQVMPIGVRYFSLYFIATGAFLQLPLCVAWLSANTIGRPKKAVAHALQIGFGNSANFVSANVFIKGESPGFRTGFTTGLVITLVGLVASCAMEAILYTKNKKADEREARGEEETKMLGMDGTRFRYTL